MARFSLTDIEEAHLTIALLRAMRDKQKDTPPENNVSSKVSDLETLAFSVGGQLAADRVKSKLEHLTYQGYARKAGDAKEPSYRITDLGIRFIPRLRANTKFDEKGISRGC